MLLPKLTLCQTFHVFGRDRKTAQLQHCVLAANFSIQSINTVAHMNVVEHWKNKLCIKCDCLILSAVFKFGTFVKAISK